MIIHPLIPGSGTIIAVCLGVVRLIFEITRYNPLSPFFDISAIISHYQPFSPIITHYHQLSPITTLLYLGVVNQKLTMQLQRLS